MSDETWTEESAFAEEEGSGGNPDGLAAFFDDPDDILAAAEKARDKKLEEWDVLTPFPVHGMDDAMGIGRSWIPWVTFCAALTGMTTALCIQIGTMTVDWPIIIGGKPFLPWPSFMPVTFELSVLFGALTTVAVMFLAGGMPNLKPQLIDPRITRDRFVLWVSSEDPQYDAVKTREFLESLGPLEVREVTFDS
jgi:hypothetical protein